MKVKQKQNMSFLLHILAIHKTLLLVDLVLFSLGVTKVGSGVWTGKHCQKHQSELRHVPVKKKTSQHSLLLHSLRTNNRICLGALFFVTLTYTSRERFNPSNCPRRLACYTELLFVIIISLEGLGFFGSSQASFWLV